jgi:hypothetical protein
MARLILSRSAISSATICPVGIKYNSRLSCASKWLFLRPSPSYPSDRLAR